MKYAAVCALLFSASGVDAQQNFLQDSISDFTNLAEDSIQEVTDFAADITPAVSSIWKSCPKTNVQQNFDKERYLGTWYELHRAKK